MLLVPLEPQKAGSPQINKAVPSDLDHLYHSETFSS